MAVNNQRSPSSWSGEAVAQPQHPPLSAAPKAATRACLPSSCPCTFTRQETSHTACPLLPTKQCRTAGRRCPVSTGLPCRLPTCFFLLHPCWTWAAGCRAVVTVSPRPRRPPMRGCWPAAPKRWRRTCAAFLAGTCPVLMRSLQTQKPAQKKTKAQRLCHLHWRMHCMKQECCSAPPPGTGAARCALPRWGRCCWRIRPFPPTRPTPCFLAPTPTALRR